MKSVELFPDGRYVYSINVLLSTGRPRATVTILTVRSSETVIPLLVAA